MWTFIVRFTAQGLSEQAPDIPACDSPEATGCVTAWNARGPRYTPNSIVLQRSDPRPLLCSNPLSWRDDGAPVPAQQNPGAVFLETQDLSVRPAFSDAQCVDGTLIVRDLQAPPRDLASRILDYVMGPQNYHPIEYQIFFMSIRENVARRIRAFLG